MEIEDDNAGRNANQKKPLIHQVLNYEKWRTHVVTQTKQHILLDEMIQDDDIHEYEEEDILTKNDLNIKVIHIYIHNLLNWYGIDADTDARDFKVEIQYGILQSNGKFKVKEHTDLSGDCVMENDIMQYFQNFKYQAGYNFLKVKIMKPKSNVKVCHCYIDLRGLQKGKFIHLLKDMNSKDYIQNE